MEEEPINDVVDKRHHHSKDHRKAVTVKRPLNESVPQQIEHGR